MGIKRRLPLYLGLTLIATLSGCSLTPNYERPAAPVAPSWNGTEVATLSSSSADWQTFILDDDLRQLVRAALDNNRSLRQALLDIEAARATYRIQRADQVPAVGVGSDASRQRLPADLADDDTAIISSSYQVGLSLPEYELDLFGRIDSLSEAALEQYLATEEAGRSAAISLIAEICQTYIDYEGAHRRLELTERTLASREASLELIGLRLNAGASTALDYQEARGLVEQARAERESNLRQKQQAFNALVQLVGSPNASTLIPSSPAASSLLIEDIVAGTPSELIERRPDILAAEHRLRARNANIGAAKAAFFPRISLTGSLGSSSAELSGLFDAGSGSWSFVPRLSLPIFEGGRNRANLNVTEVRKDAAVAAYEETIQQAFREVANALAANETLRREEQARHALSDTSRIRLNLARARYERGVDSHLRYLSAQRSRYLNESAYISVNTQRQKALIDLYRALGGWLTGA